MAGGTPYGCHRRNSRHNCQTGRRHWQRYRAEYPLPPWPGRDRHRNRGHSHLAASHPTARHAPPPPGPPPRPRLQAAACQPQPCHRSAHRYHPPGGLRGPCREAPDHGYVRHSPVCPGSRFPAAARQAVCRQDAAMSGEAPRQRQRPTALTCWCRSSPHTRPPDRSRRY